MSSSQMSPLLTRVDAIDSAVCASRSCERYAYCRPNVNIFYRLYSITVRPLDRLDNVGLSTEARTDRAVHHADGCTYAHPVQWRGEETKTKYNRAGTVQHRGDAGRRGHRL